MLPKPPKELRELVEECEGDLTHFQLLGVTPIESENDAGRVKTVRRALLSALHPDRWGQYDEGWQRRARDVAAQINVAADTLLSPRDRQMYHVKLRSTHYVCTACAGEGAKQKTRGFRQEHVQWVLCSSCDGAGLLRKDPE